MKAREMRVMRRDPVRGDDDEVRRKRKKRNTGRKSEQKKVERMKVNSQNFSFWSFSPMRPLSSPHISNESHLERKDSRSKIERGRDERKMGSKMIATLKRKER